MATFQVNSAELQKLFSSNQGPVWQHVNRIANKVQNQAQRNLSPGGATAAFDTGRLRASITVLVRNKNGLPVARVGTNLDYALFVHEGTGFWSKTRPGPIVPKRSKVLRWPKKNNSGRGRRRYRAGQTAQYVYARRSAGSPPRPFLTLALEQVLGKQ